MREILNTPHWLLAIAVSFLALALFFHLSDLGLWLLAQRRMRKQLKRSLRNRAQRPVNHRAHITPTSRWQRFLAAASKLGGSWEKGRFGSSLLAQEDRDLIDIAGFYDRHLAQSLFIFSRTILAFGLPFVFFVFFKGFTLLSSQLLSWIVFSFFGFGLGWMLPKWYLRKRVKHRQQAIETELVLFIDILRLLQGVGLSIDQAIQTINEQFKQNIPILAFELGIAQDLYTRGRSREQAFNRLTTQFHNDDLSAICRLIQQIDIHGGAVQEPLAQFSERLQEQRRLSLKEKIGTLTVKMTGVMILTLMPALLIITGGSGFLAVIRGITRVGGGM